MLHGGEYRERRGDILTMPALRGLVVRNHFDEAHRLLYGLLEERHKRKGVFDDPCRRHETVMVPAQEFGTPICVTDSYRTYDEQVRLKREKPGLAAEPGTSNHGWGMATDLCGGIQNDGTAANNWLRQNAGRFAWFHPSWADPGGSGPYEPWHWEYAGG